MSDTWHSYWRVHTEIYLSKYMYLNIFTLVVLLMCALVLTFSHSVWSEKIYLKESSKRTKIAGKFFKHLNSGHIYLPKPWTSAHADFLRRKKCYRSTPYTTRSACLLAGTPSKYRAQTRNRLNVLRRTPCHT